MNDIKNPNKLTDISRIRRHLVMRDAPFLVMFGLLVCMAQTALAELPARLFDATAPFADNARQGAAKASPARRGNPDALLAGSIAVELPSGEEVVFTRRKLEKGRDPAGAWTGTVPKHPASIAFLARQGDTLAGAIHHQGKSYNLFHSGGGTYSLTEADVPDTRHECKSAIPPDAPVAKDPSADEGVLGEQAMRINPSDAGIPHLDVMFVYTSAARTRVGGENAIQALMQSCIASGNLTLENSGVNMRLRLAGSHYTGFDESTKDWDGILNALNSKIDGVMDDIHNVREDLRADAVFMLLDKSGLCGKGYLGYPNTHSGLMFALGDVDCAAAEYTFIHELGHNLGCNHAGVNDGGYTAGRSNHGFITADGKYRSVLATLTNAGSSQRVPVLSGPGVVYNGYVMGTADKENNVGQIEYVLSRTMGAFSGSPPGFLDGAPEGFDQQVIAPIDGSVAITLTGMDPELRAVTYSVVDAPIHGALTGTAPNLVYQPASGYSGPDSFTFILNDGSLNSPPATVGITVTQTYQITYSANGADSGSAPASQIKGRDLDLTLASNSGNLVKNGFSFRGWNTTADGSGVTYPAGSNYTANAALTLYAKWVPAPVALAGSDRAILISQSTPFTPANAFPLAWYDAADAASVIHAAGSVSQWSDKTEGGNHMLQATAAKRPITGTKTIGGLNTILFDGSNDALKTASNPFGGQIQNAMFMAVANIGTLADSTFFSLSGSSGTANRWQAHAPWSDKNIYFDTGGSSGANRISKASGWAAGEDKLLAFYGSTADNVQRIWQDGTMVHSDLTGHTATVSGGMSLAHEGTSSFDNCAFGEVVILNGTVSEDTRQKLEGYLAHKWGRSGNLPAGHPHKNSAPAVSQASAALAGGASGAQGDTLIATWSLVSGPAAVAFSNPGSLDTSVSFSTTGTYVLRLTVSDGFAQGSDDVVVNVTDATPYDIWAGGTFSRPFTDKALTSDPDGDGLKNVVEFAFGMDPTSGSGKAFSYVPGGAVTETGAPALRPASPGASGPPYLATFLRRKGHATAGITYEALFSADLLRWSSTATAPGVLTDPNAENEFEAVGVPFPDTVPLNAGGTAKPNFFRININH